MDITSPRFLELNIQSLSKNNNSFDRITKSQPYEIDWVYDLSVGFPVYIGDRTRIIGELQYTNEFIYGCAGNERESKTTPLELIENSASLILSRKFNNDWRFNGIINLRVNANQFLDINSNSTRYSFAAIIGKKDKKKSTGYGLVVTKHRNVMVLPAIKHKSQINKKWGIDILIPSRVILTYKKQNQSQYLFGIRGNAASYFLGDDGEINPQLNNTFYRRININGIIGYEAMITPIFGFKSEVGFTVPLRMEISDINSHLLHDFNPGIVPYMNFGLFLALPK